MLAKSMERVPQKWIERGLLQGVSQGFKQGWQEGKQEGRQEGIESGLSQGKLEVAKKLMSKGIDTQIIIETTGLSLDELNQLKK